MDNLRGVTILLLDPVHKQSAVETSFSTYVCYAPDGLFWLNLYVTPSGGKTLKNTYVTHVEFLRKLVEHRSKSVFIFLDDRGDERDQLVPKFQIVQPWTRLFERSAIFVVQSGRGRWRFRLVGIGLEFTIVKFRTIFKQKLIG